MLLDSNYDLLPLLNKHASELAELRGEVVTLKSEIAALTKMIDRLSRQIDQNRILEARDGTQKR